MTQHAPTPEKWARKRARYLSALLWHAGTYLIINAFFWILDYWGQSGLDWAHVISLFWGIALAFHALGYYIDGRQLERHMEQQFLAEDREREAQLH